MATSGPSGVVGHGPGRRVGAGEQPVEREVQRREGFAVVHPPGLGQRAGQIGLLGEHVGRPVAHAAGLHQQHLRVVGRAGRTHEGRRRRSSHGSQLSMPSKVWPSARRSHCSRPHGSEATRASARARTSAVGSSSRHGKISTSARSTVERWSATENSVSRSTSSPHRSMRTGASAVEGNTSTIEPRTATSPRCSTWYSRRYPARTSWSTSTSGSTLVSHTDHHRLHVAHVRTEALHQGPHRGHHHAVASAGGRAGARGCAAAGPWSPPPGSPARRAASPTPGTARRRRDRGRQRDRRTSRSASPVVGTATTIG